jgi:hypothetical protein
MLPSQTQRMLLLLAVVVATPGWWVAASWLAPMDGLGGWTLGSARPGVAAAVGLVVLAGIPALGMAVLLAAAGNPLTGLLALAVSGAIAGGGAGLAGVARRADEAGGVETLQLKLGAELVTWFVLLTLAGAGIDAARRWVEPRLPERLTSRHLGGSVRLVGLDGPSLIAGLITAVVGGGLGWVLIASREPGQAVGGLALGFTAGALVGHAVMPSPRVWPSLLAPAAAGLAAYGGVAWRYQGVGGGDALLQAIYVEGLPGLALALPVHYVTAGVAGVCLGLGIGQVIDQAKLGG